jgi:hypothetical protein
MTLDEINMELKALAAYNLEMETKAIYDEMVNEMCAEFEMLEYAARSYDADCLSYGMK